jgi:PAS domain-containing protein
VFGHLESMLANPSIAGGPARASGRAEPTFWEAMGSHATSTQVHASIEPAFEGEARIARLFEMTSDLLATISLDGRFTLLNPAWEQLLGWSREELRQRHEPSRC